MEILPVLGSKLKEAPNLCPFLSKFAYSQVPVSRFIIKHLSEPVDSSFTSPISSFLCSLASMKYG